MIHPSHSTWKPLSFKLRPDAETRGRGRSPGANQPHVVAGGSGVPASWGLWSVRDPQPPRAGLERSSAARGLARVPLGQGSHLSTDLSIYSNNFFLGCAEQLLDPDL